MYADQEVRCLASASRGEPPRRPTTQLPPASPTLVAVVGIGLSTTNTVQAARQLASGASPLPMIGSVDTGDRLDTSGPQPPSSRRR